MNASTASLSQQQLTGQASATASSAKSGLGWRAFSTSSSWSPLALRAALAVVMFPHGAQKALGWFGGYGFEGTLSFFTQKIGLPAPLAVLVIATEFLGPILLLAGLGTRFVALGFTAVMLGAITTTHFANGFFMNWFGQQAGEGYEYHLLVIGMALALILGGGGRWSLDRRLTSAKSRA